ncbi:LAMI_0E00848g1_1 [Lachancea mirantina]|uniref:LAMI_0E00848g1_1 n=1 Tax=Lachancea mirantina TaxID=1230905 RepID=A0A1G4JI90_9SACH|nr:LAMI_0E00848g1_1 [Lachancea mirantina]
MKRSCGDLLERPLDPCELSFATAKKCQRYAASSGADALLALMRASRGGAKRATQPTEERKTSDQAHAACYYCSSVRATSACALCSNPACGVCCVGLPVCLNCQVEQREAVRTKC